VLEGALWILDHEGLEALSMRRLADRLGVAPNALYSHIADRLSMVDGLLDLVLRDVVVPVKGRWSDRLEQLMLRIWEALVAHPELVPHYFSREEVGPEAMRLGGAALALLQEGGVEEEQAGQAMRALMIYAIGSAAIRLPRPGPPSVDRARGESDFRAGLRWFLSGLGDGPG
jgi:TetR/AcrR family tetracycline transcriptional repressor